jgi:BASS family bile acid:Na+ symporter
LKRFIAIITNRNLILLLAIVLGLSLKTLSWVRHLTVPALAIVMIVSLTQVSFKEFLSAKKIIMPSLYTILFNYVIFGAVMLLLAWLLIDDRQLWIGFVILASAPPGVAIAPFAYIIGADEKYSIIGMVGAYIASLALIPLAGFIFIGRNFASPLDIFIIFVELIIAPMIISQVLVKLRLDKHLLKWRGAIVNWGLFVVIFAVVSLNRDVFFRDIKTLLIISLISVVSVFGLWGAVNLVLKKLKIKTGIRKSLVLAATIKNSGFAAATALALFGEKASLPGAILSIFLIIFFIIIGFEKKKKNPRGL